MKRKSKKYILIISLMLTLNVIVCSNAYAQRDRVYGVKAAFLYNFAKFVTWPNDAFVNKQSPLIIGVLGEDPFGEALKSIEGKVAQDRKIIVKQFKAENDIKICHILFISESEEGHLDRLFTSLSGKKILTVGNMAQFTQSGGVINFVIRKNKMKFEISRKSAERAQLILSSQLLKLAIIID